MGRIVHIRPTPNLAPGRHVTESLLEGIRVIKSDDVVFNETSPQIAFSVPRNTLIIGAIAEVVQAFNGTTPTVNLGDAESATRYFNLTGTNVTTTGFRQVFFAHEYTAISNVLCALVLSGATQGRIRFWLLVRTDSDKQR